MHSVFTAFAVNIISLPPLQPLHLTAYWWKKKQKHIHLGPADLLIKSHTPLLVLNMYPSCKCWFHLWFHLLSLRCCQITNEYQPCNTIPLTFDCYPFAQLYKNASLPFFCVSSPTQICCWFTSMPACFNKTHTTTANLWNGVQYFLQQYSLRAVLSLLLLLGTSLLNRGESNRYCCFMKEAFCCSKSRRCRNQR